MTQDLLPVTSHVALLQVTIPESHLTCVACVRMGLSRVLCRSRNSITTATYGCHRGIWLPDRFVAVAVAVAGYSGAIWDLGENATMTLGLVELCWTEIQASRMSLGEFQKACEQFEVNEGLSGGVNDLPDTSAWFSNASGR